MSERNKMPEGLSLPRLPQQSTQNGQQRYLMEAANGMLVSVPADKLESWLKGQEEVRNGTYKPDERLKSKIMSRLCTSKKPLQESSE